MIIPVAWQDSYYWELNQVAGTEELQGNETIPKSPEGFVGRCRLTFTYQVLQGQQLLSYLSLVG